MPLAPECGGARYNYLSTRPSVSQRFTVAALPDLPTPPDAASLLTLDDDALDKALAQLPTPEAARVIALAPTLEGKTRLLWALDDRQRREVLELTPPALVAALVQNAEEDNRYLLGDLGVEPFRRVLDLCSPARQFYWLRTAVSFQDARANALPFFCTADELADVLLSRPTFANHVRALADYPIEEQRIPPELAMDPGRTLLAIFGEERLLDEFPVADPPLRELLQTLLSWDVESYVDVIRAALRRLDYEADHADEAGALEDEAILLDRLETPAPPPAAPLAESAAAPLELAPIAGTSPLHALAASLPAERRQALHYELQALCVREAIAAGGSFAREDLEAIAASVQAYLTLGLRTLTGDDPGAAGELLTTTRLAFLHETGAREVERLRQVALRLAPHEAALDERHRAIVRSFLPPHLALTEAGEPVLALRRGADLPEEIAVVEAPSLLREAADWVSLARALRLRHVAAAFARVPDRTPLLAALAVGAALYGRVAIGLVEADDYALFAHRYLTKTGRVSRRAWNRVREAVEAWAEARELPQDRVMRDLSAGMDRVAALAREGRLIAGELARAGYVPRPRA